LHDALPISTRRLLEDEIAADALANQRQADAGALDAEIRPRRQHQVDRVGADLELLAHPDHGRIDGDAERALEAHGVAGDRERDRATQPPGEAGRGDDEEPLAVLEPDPGRGGGGADEEGDGTGGAATALRRLGAGYVRRQ